MHFSVSEIQAYTALFAWPLLRISALFVAFPVYNGQSLSIRVRTMLAMAVTLLVMPLLPPPPDLELLSYRGVMVAIQQVLIGLVTGFVLQLVFAAVVFAGQLITYSLGLSFASLVDPTTGAQVPMISQIYLLTTTLVFLGMDGHLVMIQLLVDSFRSIPVGETGIAGTELWNLLAWSGRLFAAGLLLALPALAALLLVNFSLGVAARAAPQLNIFAVGFPVTMLLGLLLVWFTLPHVSQGFSESLGEAYEMAEQLLRL